MMKNTALFLWVFLLPAMTAFSASTPPTSHPAPAAAKSADPEPSPQPVSRPKLIIPPSDKGMASPTTQKPAVSGELFFYPGVVSSKDGHWAGGDNFLNLSKSIAVQVNFIKAENAEVSFTQNNFQTLISGIFEKNGLNPNAGSSDSKPPLPFFNLIVLIFPTADGFTAACQGRLFEQVQVQRVQLKDEIFQAITWEQTHLVFGPTEEFEKMLTSTIESLTNTFVTRVAAHQAASK